MVALSVYRAKNVRVDACNSSCLVLRLQSVVYLCCVSRTVTEQQRMKLDDQWVLTVMKNLVGEICHQYSSVVTASYSLITHNKLQHALLGDYWECVRPAQLPVLTWVPSSVPLGTTSKTRSPPGPRRIQHNSITELDLKRLVPFC